MLLREVAAMKAHITPHASKSEGFKAVADVFTANIDSPPIVDAKSTRDSYERWQRNFDAKDHRDAVTSNVGGEISESQKLLFLMRDAREEQQVETP